MVNIKENIYDNFTTENCKEEFIKKFAKGLDEAIINCITEGANNQSIKDFGVPIDRDKLKECLLLGIEKRNINSALDLACEHIEELYKEKSSLGLYHNILTVSNKEAIKKYFTQKAKEKK